MKLVVDNMATQCVEDILMKSVPDLFSASIVLEMDADTIERIARESIENASRRDQLHNMARVLESGQETCRRHVSSHRNGDLHLLQSVSGLSSATNRHTEIHDDSHLVPSDREPDQLQTWDEEMYGTATALPVPAGPTVARDSILRDFGSLLPKKRSKAKQ
ncbi:hypothetical protein LTR56_028019 [Elasticomyces elasticus]|nr:hypothetical protein LTR56_028019 [Elasticomyces elasticus]KAK5721236.1 hypothetical protein LTS12_027605 [Elasticomyces elasticus]